MIELIEINIAPRIGVLLLNVSKITHICFLFLLELDNVYFSSPSSSLISMSFPLFLFVALGHGDVCSDMIFFVACAVNSLTTMQ